MKCINGSASTGSTMKMKMRKKAETFENYKVCSKCGTVSDMETGQKIDYQTNSLWGVGRRFPGIKYTTECEFCHA